MVGGAGAHPGHRTDGGKAAGITAALHRKARVVQLIGRGPAQAHGRRPFGLSYEVEQRDGQRISRVAHCEAVEHCGAHADVAAAGVGHGAAYCPGLAGGGLLPPADLGEIGQAVVVVGNPAQGELHGGAGLGGRADGPDAVNALIVGIGEVHAPAHVVGEQARCAGNGHRAQVVAGGVQDGSVAEVDGRPAHGRARDFEAAQHVAAGAFVAEAGPVGQAQGENRATVFGGDEAVA